MSHENAAYAFSTEAKIYVHERAGEDCEFPANGCERPNNGIVHHLTGKFEGRLAGVPPEVVSDPVQNAFMLCDLHAKMHDVEEAQHVEQLIFDARTLPRAVRNARSQRRRSEGIHTRRPRHRRR